MSHSRVLPFLQPSRDPYRTPRGRPLDFPTSEEAWNVRYNWLFSQYVGEHYSHGDEQTFQLFSALDEDGKVIAETRRLTRDVQHIVDTDTRGMAAAPWSLEAGPAGSTSDLLAGEAIWRRSRWQQKKAKHARHCAMMGDTMVESVRDVNGAKLVGYDPRHVRLEYMPDGIELQSAVIDMAFFDVEPNSLPVGEEPVLRVQRRVLDRETVRIIELDPDTGTEGRVVSEGRHGLGVVPLVHVPFLEVAEPNHGLWAAHGIETAVAQVDSHIAQIRAIANRYANPLLAVFGATVGEGVDIFKFGRVLSGIDPTGRVEYVEAGAQAIQGLWQVIREYKDDLRHTIPEFMFASGAGANTSGRALDIRADQFRLKVEEVRSRYLDAIARATQYARALEQGVRVDQSQAMYRIAAPPVLPIDVGTRLTQVQVAWDAGWLRKIDAVRQLQAVGILGEEIDAEDYTAKLDAEAAPPPVPLAIPQNDDDDDTPAQEETDE